MPRSPRPLGAECTYHVTARGNNRQVIFHENADRAAWIELLDQSVSQRSWGIAAYCLVTNHVHLVVRTPRGDLDGGMRDLLSRYARRHNRLRGVTGHLFGGRYRATLIESDAQLRATIRYVARNPVEAGLVGRPGDWPWSRSRVAG